MENLATNPADTSRDFASPTGNRRRRVRHRVHTPAYAALNSSCEDRTLELHEVLNISEDGLAIQASSPLQLNQIVNLCLDLSETGVKIQNPGRVVWLSAGKAGICFSGMSPAALSQLQQWLFTNTALACVYRAAEEKSEAEAQAARDFPPPTAGPVSEPRDANESAFPADYTSTLAALAAVEREIAALGGDLDLALRLVAQRAIAFTHSTGAAVALTNGPGMVCRGSAGPDAPSLGARFNIGSGFSGECVRTGRTLHCEDTETDPFVDKESCRVLGVRSMIAVPIRSRESLIGLLEIFSPKPAAFGIQDETVLQRLAEMVSQSVHRAGLKTENPSQTAAPVLDDELYAETPVETTFPSLSMIQKVLLIAAALTLVVAVSWLLQPWNLRRSASDEISSPAQSQAISKSALPANSPKDFPAIRKLAEQGDAAAQFAVGAHYATGEDAPQDYAEAVRWFTRAAEQGHVGAQATLGAYYWSGRGVPPDLSKAYFWAILAQTGGDDASRYRVAFLSSRMSRSQIAAAQQQANEWLKQHESSTPAPPSSK